MGPICQCGCGGYLPEGSARRYIRGHSPEKRAPRPAANAPKAQRNADAEDNTEWTDADEPMPFWEITDDGTFSIADAARSVPDDPDPLGGTENRQSFEIKITAAVRRDIRGKLAFMLGMTGNLWQMVDPTCGTVMLERVPEISKALVPIMCQSPDVVRWFQRASNFSLYFNLIMAVWPLISVVYAHHLAHSIGDNGQGMNGHASAVRIPENAYTVT
jgi:hypothetical protein